MSKLERCCGIEKNTEKIYIYNIPIGVSNGT